MKNSIPGNLVIGLCTLVTSLIGFSCSGSLNGSEYIAYVEHTDNDLKQEYTAEAFTFTLQYKPTPYIAMQEHRTTSPSKALIDSFNQERDGMHYFNFKILSNTGQDIHQTNTQSDEEQAMRQYYFTSVMQGDLFLIDGNDTLPCALYHFERNYGLAPYNNIVLGFEKGSVSNADLQFIWFDQALTGEEVRLTIPGDRRKQLPELQTI